MAEAEGKTEAEGGNRRDESAATAGERGGEKEKQNPNFVVPDVIFKGAVYPDERIGGIVMFV
jgi:hypothetical protein